MIRQLLLTTSALFFIANPVSGQTLDTSPIADLGTAFSMAYKHNPGLRAERAALRATEEELPQAYANWLPNLSLNTSVTAQNTTGDGVDNSTDGGVSKEYGVSLSQNLYRGGRTFLEYDEALHNIAAERANLLQEEQDLFLDVVEAYTTIIRDRAVLNLQRQNQTLLEERLRNSQLRFEGGEATRTDVNQSEARLADAVSDSIDAEVDLDTALANFENLTGFRPADELAVPDLRPQLVSTLPELIDQAMIANPTVISLQYEHLAAKKDIEIQRRALYPQLSLNASYRYEDEPQPGNRSFQDNSTVGLRMEVPLYEGGSIRSQVREAKSTANQAKLELIQEMRDVRESVIRNFREYNAAKSRIEAREIQVRAAQTARDGVFQEVQAGERTYVDLLDSDQEVLDATVDLITAQRTAILEEYAVIADIGLLSASFVGVENPLTYEQATSERLFTSVSNHFSMDTPIDQEKNPYVEAYEKKYDDYDGEDAGDSSEKVTATKAAVEYKEPSPPKSSMSEGALRRILYAPVKTMDIKENAP